MSAHSFEGCQVLLYRFRLAAASCPDFTQEPPARRRVHGGAGIPEIESNWGVMVAKEQLSGLRVPLEAEARRSVLEGQCPQERLPAARCA